jgi:peptide/nickel transport system permease protein
LQGCTLFGAFLIMMSNFIVDLLYPLLDPRVRL